MRSNSVWILATVLLVISATASAAAPSIDSYDVTRMPVGGDVIRDIDIHPTKPNIVYLIGQTGGAYKSTDFGKNWVQVRAMDGRGIGIDHQNPDTVYAAGFGGVYKTTDGGKTWKQVLDKNLRSLGVHPVSGAVFAGGNGGNMYVSNDGGATWLQPKSATTGEINKWAFHPTDKNTIYHSAAKNRGIYKSTDGGTTWAEVRKEYGRCVAISKSDPNVVYGSGSHSLDGGKTWKGSGGESAWAVAIHPKDPKIVYKASQGDGVYATYNGGKSWSQVKGLTRGGPTDLTAHWSIAYDGENDIVYVGAAVLYKAEKASSPDATLVESNEGIYTPIVKSIIGNKNVMWVGTDGQGVLRSSDYGHTWQRKLLGLRSKLNLGAMNIHPLDSDIIYSAGEGGLVKTQNGGEIWLHMPKPGGAVGSVVVDPNDKNGVYTVCNNKVFESRNGGFTWTLWAPAEKMTVQAFTIHPTQHRTMLVETEEGWKRTKDAGATWESLPPPPDGGLYPSKLAKTPDTYYVRRDLAGLWKSTDGGKTWNQIYKGGRNNGGLIEAADGTLWLGDNNRVHRSTDGGTTWEELPIEGWVRGMLVDPHSPDALYVACQGGLFRVHPKGVYMVKAPPPPPPPTSVPTQATLQISAAGVLDRANTVYQLTKNTESRGTAFFIIADNITLDGQGHEVIYDVSLVEAFGVKNLTIKNVTGIQSQTTQGTSHGRAHAIDLSFCNDATISAVKASPHRRACSGVACTGANTKVIDCEFTVGPFATAVDVDGDGGQVLRNKIVSSSSGRGIRTAGKNTVIENNEITYGGPTSVSGLDVNVGDDSRVKGNTIRGGGQNVGALSVRNSTGVSVESNDIESPSPQVELYDSRNVTVRGNKFVVTHQRQAFQLVESDGNTFTDNDLTTMAPKGIVVLKESSKNNFAGNRITGGDLAAEGALQADEKSKDNVIKYDR